MSSKLKKIREKLEKNGEKIEKISPCKKSNCSSACSPSYTQKEN